MKQRYRCELLGLQDCGEDQYVALIRRHERHIKLGVPTMSHTRTSLILRIDFVSKEIETLNSIYCYGD